MSSRVELMAVAMGEKVVCSHCGATHINAQPSTMLVQLPLPAPGAPSVQSMVEGWGEKQVLEDYVCGTEGCEEKGATKESVFAMVPDVLVFGMQ